MRVIVAKGLPISVASACLCLLIACSREQKVPGQLVVAIDTDVALPDQIDTIELQVTVDGTTLLDYPMPVGTGPDAQPIPATLTIVSGPDPSVPVTVRVLGSKVGTVRTLREVTTTIPTDRIATLRMPVQWLCDGTAVQGTEADGGVGYQSTCGPGATCEAGQCVASQVQESTLADYEPQAIFGGGSAPTSKGQTTGTCFDTVACMVSGTVEAPDDQCTVDLPPGDDVNVALRVADDGICDTTGTQCFVPLDGDSTEGWTEQAGRIALPPAVCTKLRQGLIAGVVVSTTCATKTDADPPCGAWSSVAPASDAAPASEPDASGFASTTPVLVASAAPEAGASTVCCPLLADANALYTCLCDGSAAVQVVSIDPSGGDTRPVASFLPQATRTQYAAVLAGGEVYWVDRIAGSDAGDTCPVFGTSTADGGTAGPVAVVQGDVYDEADLLADAANLYALADNVSGLSAAAAPVQALRIDRSTGAVTPLDTGGARPLFQFTQDSTSLYVGVDTDVALDGGVERVSRIVQFAKSSGASTTLVEQTLTTSDASYGGFIGLQDDGTTLFALYEAAPASDGTVDTQVVVVDSSDGGTSVLYDEVDDPTLVSFRLLGAVSGAVVLVRDVTAQPEAGAGSSESSVLVIPPGGGAPRIVASFAGDAPIFELQAPTFTADVFWLNASGRVFRLPAAALE